MSKWEMVRLGDVATYVNGFAFKPADWSNKGIPIIRIQNLTGTSDVVNYYDKKYSTKYEINNGDVLISWSASLGVYEWKKGKALLNQHIFKVVFDKLVLDKRFFVFVIAEKLREMSSLVHGSTMKHITKKYFDRIEIQLPPLESQKKIATALDSANALIEKRKEQIEKLDLLIKSQFIEMFGDPVTNPKGWEKKKLKKECDVITGNTPSRLNLSNYGNYIEWIKSDNINTTSMYLTQAREGLSEEGLSIARSVDEGNILMTCIAGSLSCIGNVAIADRKVSFNQQINAIVPKENNHLFIYHLLLLSKPYIQGKVNMSLKGILSKGKLLELEFFFPPLSLQIQFAEFVEKVEAQKALLKKSLADMEQNYQSLMQKCFKGEIF